MACIHCGSIAVKRNGKYRSRQLYLCKDCNKTFNDMTNTPFSGSLYPEKWVKFMEMMVEGYTLPKIAKRLKIHISTAFYWRHKILNALRLLDFNQLQDIIVRVKEIDAAIEKYIDPKSLLCRDTATNYKKFNRIKGLKHEPINERQKQRIKKGIYHIQNANNFHSRLKPGLEGFRELQRNTLIITYTGSAG